MPRGLSEGIHRAVIPADVVGDDAETGLYYLRNRYYDPEWGRFVNADLLLGKTGTLLSHNLFTYCVNNPVNMTDSTGLEAVSFSDIDWSALQSPTHGEFVSMFEAVFPDTYFKDGIEYRDVYGTLIDVKSETSYSGKFTYAVGSDYHFDYSFDDQGAAIKNFREILKIPTSTEQKDWWSKGWAAREYVFILNNEIPVALGGHMFPHSGSNPAVLNLSGGHICLFTHNTKKGAGKNMRTKYQNAAKAVAKRKKMR